MNTVKDKIGVFAIHTPSMQSVARRWKGLLDNHRYVRVVKCDLSVACASVLPADPLQVGVESDQIAPQDMMNPILYRAVSNDSWNTVLNRVYMPSTGGSPFSDVNSVKFATDGFPSLNAEYQERLYYALLAEAGWRKAMPQAGFSMKDLVPIVYPVLSTYGNTEGDSTQLTNPNGLISNNLGEANTPTAANTLKPIQFKGRPQPMPRVPCTSAGSQSVDGDPPVSFWNGTIPRTYVACILMPPNKSGNVLYFRMIIRWTLEFSELVTFIEKESATNTASAGTTYLYNRTYEFPTSSKISDVVQGDDTTVDTNSLETLNGDAKMIMEK